MKVIFSKDTNQYTLYTLTKGKCYDVLEHSVFGNRNPEYKIKNDLGSEIWVNSDHFERLDKKRESKIDSLLN